MKLSYINGFGNKGNTFVAQSISTDSLPHQANSNTTHQYLTPDYFLASSSSDSYYSRKYSGNNHNNNPSHQSRYSKIVRIVSVSHNMSVQFVGSRGKHTESSSKPRLKLLSFESHLNYKIALEGNITLIPSLGFRYEYGRIGSSRGQILGSYILDQRKSSNTTLSGELGSRVLFTLIKLSSDFTLTPTAHISLEKRIVGRGGKSGQLLSLKDIGGESTLVSGNFASDKLRQNVDGGLIASYKNMSLEFLYDVQKQRSYKAHQGVLKLKVNLYGGVL